MAAMNRDGYVLLPSVVPPAQQARLRAFIDAQPWPAGGAASVSDL